MMAGVTSFTLLMLAIIYRPLGDGVIRSGFHAAGARTRRHLSNPVHDAGGIQYVEGYRALGTLMASGLLIIPAVIVQFWSRNLVGQMALAVITAMAGSLGGLMLAAAYKVPSGPPIVIALGGIYFVSLLFGRFGSVRARYFPFRHLEKLIGFKHRYSYARLALKYKRLIRVSISHEVTNSLLHKI